MTSITERHTPREGEDMGPVEVNERTTISVPVVLTLGGIVLGAVMWANAFSIALAEVKKDQFNDRDRLQRIEQSLERVESKLDRLKDERR